MRFAILTIGLFVALLALPRIDAVSPTNRTAAHPLFAGLTARDSKLDFSRARLAALSNAPTLPTQTRLINGAEALVFIATPGINHMPAMPDIPEPISAISPELSPTSQNPPGTLTELVLSEVTPIASTNTTDVVPNARITGNGLALRAGPGTSHSTLGALYRGDPVQVTGARAGKWTPIRVVATGRRGWVFHKYVSRL